MCNRLHPFHWEEGSSCYNTGMGSQFPCGCPLSRPRVQEEAKAWVVERAKTWVVEGSLPAGENMGDTICPCVR
jgi:hypothetical protein